MPSGTRSYVTVYDYSPDEFENLKLECDTTSYDFFEHIVPHLKEWGEVHYIELEDLEYDSRHERLTFTCETKWSGPIAWLKAASASEFFTHKLMTMAIITRDESVVDAVAVLDMDILQERNLVELALSAVGELYTNDEVDELDRLLWMPIEEFNKECIELYLVSDRKDHDDEN
tara:strand:+ start:57 stop:575 length:519 start_codon:yes stop_codon:yes gene_type:complete